MTVRQSAHTINFPFRDVWSISDRQKGLITCTSISPSGVWLVSASQDGDLLFLDYKAGVPVGIFDLESKFYATAAIWRSDTTLIFGCSNGLVYHLNFEHTSKRPVSICAMIKPLRSPIRCIAFDTYRDMLAVACGGEVWIYVQSANSPNAWDCVDHILAPCAGAASLVMAMCFFGTALSCRHLFIGYAKAGWTIWLAPRSYHRTPFIDGGGVCSIGDATIPPSEKFIAISTLDNSLITYTLKEGGPAIDTGVKANLPELTDYCPVLPIVSNSSDLVLKGTAVGNLEVLDVRSGATASLQHSHKQIIRTLNAYGDKIVVASSSLNATSVSSCIRCYTLASAAEPRDWRRIDELQGPIFEITLSSILPLSERILLFNPFGIFNIVHTMRFGARWKSRMAFLLVLFGGLVLALALDPPALTTTDSTNELDVSTQDAPYTTSYSTPRKPTLSTLALWCARHLGKRLSAWFIYISETVGWVTKLVCFVGVFLIKNLLLALALLMRVALVVPRLLVGVIFEIPDALVDFICDVLKLHGYDDICPEW